MPFIDARITLNSTIVTYEWRQKDLEMALQRLWMVLGDFYDTRIILNNINRKLNATGITLDHSKIALNYTKIIQNDSKATSNAIGMFLNDSRIALNNIRMTSNYAEIILNDIGMPLNSTDTLNGTTLIKNGTLTKIRLTFDFGRKLDNFNFVKIWFIFIWDKNWSFFKS